MPDYTQTVGFQRDKAQFFRALEKLTDAIEANTAAIADAPVPTADAVGVRPTAAALFEAAVERAARHGLDSEPDHEVGDLQDVLREALQLMTPHQLGALHDALGARGLEGWSEE